MKKIIKILVCFCLIYTPFFANAVELPENNSWSWKHHEKTREQARLKAHLVKQINESGSKKAVDAIVETRPTASKVGGAMFKRLMSSAGGKMLGVYAVTELIEGIGWVMEEGTYVKKIHPIDEIPPNGKYLYQAGWFTGGDLNQETAPWHQSPTSACADTYTPLKNAYKATSYTCVPVSGTSFDYQTCVKGGAFDGSCFKLTKKEQPFEPQKTKDVPLTPALLGAAMLGQGYKDPDPNFNNDTVNTDKWTSVPDSYTPDPSGVGNELADELEKKADAAPDTPDGKPSGLSDPRYTNDLESNDAANDRSWESGDGTQGSTDSSTSTDPETGETTQTGSFKLPAFCDWAMTVCEWYEGWKKTDTKVNEHIDEEKSFWQTVKDWFVWTKEEPDQHDEDTEVEVNDLEIPDIDTSILKAAGQCPADFSYPFPLPFGGTYTISYSYATVCYWFSKLYYIVISVAWIVAYKIVTGVGGTKQDG